MSDGDLSYPLFKAKVAGSFMSKFLPALTLGAKLDLIGLSLVTIAVIGTLALRFVKFPYNPTNFSSIEKKFGIPKKIIELVLESLLCLGLALELYALPQNLSEFNKLQTNVEDIDPHNQVVNDITATLVLRWNPPKIHELSTTKNLPVAVIKLVRDTKKDVKPILPTLEADEFTRDFYHNKNEIPTLNYIIHFHSDTSTIEKYNDMDMPDNFAPMAGEVLTNVNSLIVDAAFLPKKEEDVSGVVELVINGNLRKKFQIYSGQNGTTNNETHFVAIATNGVEHWVGWIWQLD